jgi:hypothetical protein
VPVRATAPDDAARHDAARNNADWCEAVCRAHGHPGVFGRRAWTSPRRTPPLYPDAVTLAASASVADVLDGVDAGPGCSVKDSFARLDLAGEGFRPIVEATWIERSPDRPPPSRPADRWSDVRTDDQLGDWVAAWADGPDDPFRPALLADPAVRILAARRDGRVVAGAVVNRSAAVLGVSNVFAVDGDLDRVWAGLLAALPGERLVGYERGPALDAALRHGWTAVGPLRVWLRPG